jgi:DivIVA domain-containing protein
VAEQRFNMVALKMGYRMDDVDDYLDEAERLLRKREVSP